MQPHALLHSPFCRLAAQVVESRWSAHLASAEAGPGGRKKPPMGMERGCELLESKRRRLESDFHPTTHPSSAAVAAAFVFGVASGGAVSAHAVSHEAVAAWMRPLVRHRILHITVS